MALQISFPSPLPLRFKTNTDISNLFCRHTNAVAVKYCVLRRKEENYT